VLAALVLTVPGLLGAGPDGSGETIGLAGNAPGEHLDVTLVQVVDPATPGTGAPAGADRLVAVRFRLENTGSARYEDSPAASAHLLDSGGRRFDALTGADAVTTAGESFPGTVTLDPGSTSTGFVTFRLTEESPPAAVQFALNGGLADDVGQWSLF
jgi:hypothetical protein